MSSSEKNISPDKVSHEVSTTDESLCSNAETSVREDKVCVTGEEDQDSAMYLSLSLTQGMTTL